MDLFTHGQAIGIVEAVPDESSAKLNSVEKQSEGLACARLKWITNA
ncbi:MAG: hypothetical protein OXI87_07240 [Albidovulum sp.]|nr:hypothetical protein [Albidovulum sp.]MDE0304662.1 hypothetical protein [Albidovulum sp.]MDE0530407.1 hypothetical protein [Albidovulum sp.]